jgi:hypothetical protein
MDQTTGRQNPPNMPQSEPSDLNAGPVNGDTRASANDTSHIDLHEPFAFLAKPFDHPKQDDSTATRGLARSALQIPVGANTIHSGDREKHLTYHVIPRPWATQPAQQALKGPAAHPPRASQHPDPLLRWQAESMAECPYHMVASVSRLQQSSSQSWSRQGAPCIMDVPSQVSAAKGTFRDVRE